MFSRRVAILAQAIQAMPGDPDPPGDPPGVPEGKASEVGGRQKTGGRKKGCMFPTPPDHFSFSGSEETG